MVDLERGSGLEQAPLVHDDDPAAQEQRLHGLGGGVDDDGPAAGEEGRQLDPQLLAQLVVEVDQGLVQEEEPGLLGQRPADGGALLLAARQRRWQPVQEMVDAQEPRHLPDPAVDLGTRSPGQAQRRGDVLEHRERGIVDELLVDHGDVAAAQVAAGDVLAVLEHPALARPVEPGQDAQERGLAGQRRAQEHVEPGCEIEVQGVQVDLARDPFGDALQPDAQAARPAVAPRPWRRAAASAPIVPGGLTDRP